MLTKTLMINSGQNSKTKCIHYTAFSVWQHRYTALYLNVTVIIYIIPPCDYIKNISCIIYL